MSVQSQNDVFFAPGGAPSLMATSRRSGSTSIFAQRTGSTIFGMFRVTCPVCSAGSDDFVGREVTIGFLDHTLRFGDPIIRAAASTAGSLGDPTAPAAGEPLTANLDDVAYLTCPEPECGRQSGPYTARELRHQLLRSWRTRRRPGRT